MKITSLVIKNYHFTLVVFMLFIIAGLIAVFEMPRMENPEMRIPGATVTAVYPGASPADIKELIVIPIEDEINKLEDVKEIRAKIKDGIASISVEFDFGVDPENKFEEVVRHINGIRNDLPEEMYMIDFMEWKSSDVAMLQLALTSDSCVLADLHNIASGLRDELKQVPAVREVDILGMPEKYVSISMDPYLMDYHNVSIVDIEKAIHSANQNIPAGEVTIGRRAFSLKTSGTYQSLQEIRNTVVKSDSGRLVYLDDFADIYFKYEEERHITKYNQQRALFLVIRQKEGRNVLDTEQTVKKKISNYKHGLSVAVDFYRVFDQAAEVRSRINDFLWNLLQGIIIVGILIFISLGFRSAFVVILAIPLSILMGLAGIFSLDYGMEQISIAGLVIALGLLVDNSIVMVENIARFVRQGFNPGEASVKAASEVGWPVISATVTTILAFVPLVMMPDKAGEFLRSLPLTVIFTLSFSLLIALTLTPLILKWFYGFKTKSLKTESSSWFHDILQKIINGSYKQTLIYALNHKGRVVFITLVLLVISSIAFKYVGLSFFPKAEKPQFMITVNSPEGSDFDYTGQTVRKIEEVLDTIEQIEFYASNIGHGNPRIYYNYFSTKYDKEYGEIFVKLKDYEPDEFENFIYKLRMQFSTFYQADVFVEEFEQGTPVEAPIMIYMTGREGSKLRQLADKVEGFVRGQEGAINVVNDMSKERIELVAKINKDKAAFFGVPLVQIDKAIKVGVSGFSVASYRDENGEEYEMVIGIPHHKKSEFDELDKLYVTSLNGEQIPVKQFVDFNFSTAPGELSRYGLKNAALITANLEKGYSLDLVMNAVMDSIKILDFPQGYGYTISGEMKERRESFGGMQNAIIIAMIAVFAVLVFQFKSFRQPLIIFTAVPLAAIGSVWALLITGYTFSFTAFIGLTSLIGIVINNSIILVDYTNQLRRNGEDFFNAVLLAGMTRFTPIILTTLTTIGGLLPLTLRGGSLWAPLGWTIIGGLLVSTMLTLVLVPVLYSMFEKGKE
jgi:multidrug efflux pump subunit AcrB